MADLCYNYSSLSWATCFLFPDAFCFTMHKGAKPLPSLVNYKWLIVLNIPKKVDYSPIFQTFRC